MDRIGIAASKMAQGNLLAYNLLVIFISCLFSLFIFLVCGFSVLAVLFLVSLVLRVFMPSDFQTMWLYVAKICLIALAAIVGILNTVAIIRNIRLTKTKI